MEEKNKLEENKSNNQSGSQVVIDKHVSKVIGPCALTVAILGCILCDKREGLLLLPLAIILSIIAITKRQYGLGAPALIITIYAVYMRLFH